MPLQFELSGKLIILDEESMAIWSAYSWHYDGRRSIFATINGKRKLLHRVLMGEPNDLEIDHINGNPLDNRLSNLRICTHAENMKNRKMHENNSLGIKGIYFEPSSSKSNPYRAQIRVDGKKISIGRFANADDAAKAYQIAAKKYHGEFARST